MAYQTFQEFVQKYNINIDIIVTEDDTHTAQQAADVHGVPVSNIVKSLLVKVGDEFKLFLVPGDRRLDIEKLKERFGITDVRMASAQEVKDVTGYSIGGVPPFGHTEKISTYVEEGFDESIFLVAAAGSSNSVFKISLKELRRIVV